jgi:hypothetical protein
MPVHEMKESTALDHQRTSSSILAALIEDSNCVGVQTGDATLLNRALRGSGPGAVKARTMTKRGRLCSPALKWKPMLRTVAALFTLILVVSVSSCQRTIPTFRGRQARALTLPTEEPNADFTGGRFPARPFHLEKGPTLCAGQSSAVGVARVGCSVVPSGPEHRRIDPAKPNCASAACKDEGSG